MAASVKKTTHKEGRKVPVEARSQGKGNQSSYGDRELRHSILLQGRGI